MILYYWLVRSDWPCVFSTCFFGRSFRFNRFECMDHGAAIHLRICFSGWRKVWNGVPADLSSADGCYGREAKWLEPVILWQRACTIYKGSGRALQRLAQRTFRWRRTAFPVCGWDTGELNYTIYSQQVVPVLVSLLGTRVSSVRNCSFKGLKPKVSSVWNQSFK